MSESALVVKLDTLQEEDSGLDRSDIAAVAHVTGSYISQQADAADTTVE